MTAVLSILFTLHHEPDEAFYERGAQHFCRPRRAPELLPVSDVLLCRCDGKTQYLYEFSEFVIPLCHLLFFHTDGMFVILINVSIFRMSRDGGMSLYILKLSADACCEAMLLVFGVTFYLT